MKLFDRLRRRDTYEFEVDGYHFRVVVTPGAHTVEWLDCPSPYVPSGYSATRMYSMTKPMSKLRECYCHWRHAPLASKDDLVEDVTRWLEGVYEGAEEDGVELGPKT